MNVKNVVINGFLEEKQYQKFVVNVKEQIGEKMIQDKSIEEILTIMETQKEKPNTAQFIVCSGLLANYNGSDEQFRSYMNRYFIL